MKGCIVYDAHDFTSDFVTLLQEMREIILAKGGIVLLQSADTLLFLDGRLTDETLRVCDALYLPAVFLPLQLHLFEFCNRSHTCCVL